MSPQYYVRVPRHDRRLRRETTAPGKKDEVAPDAQEPPQEPPEVDDEGLLKSGYDVILSGTGLVQSVLASALSRAGRTVLHVDSEEYYGELDAVLNLEGLDGWSEEWGAGDKSKLEGEDVKPPLSLHPRGVHGSVRVRSVSNDDVDDRGRFEVGGEVVTPLGRGVVAAVPTATTEEDEGDKEECRSLAVRLSGWGSIAHFGYHPATSSTPPSLEEYMVQHHSVLPLHTHHKNQMRAEGRRFALDLNPVSVYAVGKGVDGLVRSGVAEYCEFKMAKGLYVLMEEEGKKMGAGRKTGARTGRIGRRRKKGGNDFGAEDKAGEDETTATAVASENGKAASTEFAKLRLERVPCSKSEVFKSNLLGPLDKRKLMKFLQLASDYAVAVQAKEALEKAGGAGNAAEAESAEGDGEVSVEGAAASSSSVDEIQGINELELKVGRSLGRPQNKEVSTAEMDVLRKCMDDNMSFDEYLKEKHNLPDRLRSIVIYAMAMAPSSSSDYDTEQGMADLTKHLTSLGRFPGGTAFLVPMYGSGELSQSFCRSSAVHGGTYLLRRAALGVATAGEGGNVHGIVLSTPDANDRGAASERNDSTAGSSDAPAASTGKTVKSKHVVVPRSALRTTPEPNKSSTRKVVHRRISIHRGPLITEPNEEDNEQRYIIVIPPGMSGIGNEAVIHGVAVDSSVDVAPEGYTVLHLTMAATITSEDEEGAAAAVLDRAARAITDRSRTEDSAAEEMYRLSFRYDLDDSDGGGGDDSVTAAGKGLHVSSRPTPSATVESAFEEAERLFREILLSDTNVKEEDIPEFLARSRRLDDEIRERLGDAAGGGGGNEDDDEDAVLSSAAAMIGGGGSS